MANIDKTRRRARAIAIVVVGALAAAGSECGGAGGEDGSGEVYEGLDSELRELVDRMNDERADVGAPPLELRSDLVCAAQDHSEDIGEAGVCSHDGTDGSTFPERVEACGGSGARSETIACGARTPEAVVEGWLNSPPHRDAMLDESHSEVGLGVHNNYWTAVYAF